MKKEINDYISNQADIFVLRTGVSCNNNCIHCFNGEKRKNDIAGDLTFEKLKSIVDTVDKNLAIMVSGGEVTIRKDLPELLQHIRDKGHDTIVQSNGFKFGDLDYVKKIAPYLDLVNIPIHSYDSSIFDAITQIPGSFKQTIQGIKNLQSLGVYVSTQTVINKLNYKILPETFDFIQNILPGARMQLTFCIPAEIAYSMEVQAQYKNVKKYVLQVMKKYAYLIHTHYLPKCILYPYHAIPFMLDDTDDGSVLKPGWDYANNEWNFFDYGKIRENLRVKSPSCKECIFNNECVGILRKYVQLFSEFDENFYLSDDLIPIKSGYFQTTKSNNEIKNIAIINRVIPEEITNKAKYLDYKNNIDGKIEVQKIWAEYLDKKTVSDYLTLYIHIPYCSQKCLYCEYFSKVTTDGIPEKCLDHLEEQFKEANKYFKNEKLKAINFGGGTPNLLSPMQLERILKMIHQYWDLDIALNNEMGFEFNPAHLTEEHIKVLENSYINRISMGVQSFDKNVLSNENRLYSSPEKIKDIYNRIKKFAKFVNVDLLAGLIGQTPEILLNDVQVLLDIGVEAITVYEVNKMPLHNKNKEVQHEYIEMLLMELNKKFGDYPGYTYVGTTPETGFAHCNRLYKNGQYSFKNFYCPAPQGYNNLIAFSIDDDIKIHPYSHFICINKAYQRISNDKIHFYTIDGRQDRPMWLGATDKRGTTAFSKKEDLFKMKHPDLLRGQTKHLYPNRNLDINVLNEEAGLFILRLGFSCKAKCIHCFIENKRAIKDLTFNEIKQTIDTIKKGSIVTVTGGEPTNRNDLLEILTYLRQNDYIITLETNGIMLSNKHYFETLKPFMDFAFIPIHSCVPEIHDATTRVPGSFFDTMLGLKNLYNSEIFEMTITVFNKLNYKTIVSTFDMIQDNFPGQLMSLTFPHPIGAAHTKDIVPRYIDTKPYIQELVKKWGHLMFVHYIPKCFTYPYQDIILDVGVKNRFGSDYIDGKWQTLNIGDPAPDAKIKPETCKVCIFYSECAGVWKEYAELYPDLEVDLIPIRGT